MKQEKNKKRPPKQKKHLEDESTPKTSIVEKDEKSPEEKKITVDAPSAHKNPLTETVDNIEEGVRVVSEKTAEITGKLFQQMKDGVSKAYSSSSKLLSELTHTAQNYADKYKTDLEIKKINKERELMVTRLGKEIHQHFLLKGTVSNAWFDEPDMVAFIRKIKKSEAEMIHIGNKLDKTKVD